MAKKRTDSPAQIAHRVTWRLEGELKRLRRHYLRIGELLARIRDEKHWRALKFESIESWAQERLGLGRSALYQYLGAYDWVREHHPEWLRPKVKGFIPEVSDIAILRAIEKRLDGRVPAERRKILESLRDKALAGELTREEYAAAVGSGRKQKPPLRAFADELRALAKSAQRVPGLPADVAPELAAILARVDAALRAHSELARIAPAVKIELAALGVHDFSKVIV